MPKPTISPFAGSNSAWQLAWQLAPTWVNRAGDTPTRHGSRHGSWNPLTWELEPTLLLTTPRIIDHFRQQQQQQQQEQEQQQQQQQHKTTTNQQQWTM